ncbi:MAG TPA: hypothetical protein VJM31_07845 [Vicinamibacterales bacterium]|nr:hypothetical protein [Vicinamibacterales bacterium]
MRRKSHVLSLLLLAAMAIAWTWPLALHFRDHIPGEPGDNYSFLWNLWWMRKALSAPELRFFESGYLFSPFGVDLVNHPHTALQGYISATALAGLSVIEAENLYIIVSVFLNAACAYALTFDIVRERRLALLAGMAFGGSPYVAAHLLGHFDLLTAWVLPLFALFLRRALNHGRILAAIGCGLCAAIAAYSAYYHVVYIALFALAYTLATWNAVRLSCEPRPQRQVLFTTRLLVLALLALDVFIIVVIAMSGGTSFTVAGVQISMRGLHNPLLVLWLLAFGWMLTKWRPIARAQRPPSEVFWRCTQALMIALAVFTVLCLPLIGQAAKLVYEGHYVSQVYFWRSAPRGVDMLAPMMGNPFHPYFGAAVSRLYEDLGLDRIEAVGWIGIVPIVVSMIGRGNWFDSEEARRWKVVLIVFALWALGPFVTAAGVDLGLPLPQALARFVPIVENARMPGRAMVGVYLTLGVLMALRLAGLKAGVGPTFRSAALSSGFVWAAIALLAVDYLHAPIPLTALDRPVVYEQLASITDNGPVIEVPFGIGDGLTMGRGSQERRLLYHATIHGHPVVGGYIGRMPPIVAQAYDAMPIVRNLLRLSNGEEPIDEDPPSMLQFRYLVLDTNTASPELIDYVRSTLDMDLIASGGGKELYAVQGAKNQVRQARTGAIGARSDGVRARGR